MRLLNPGGISWLQRSTLRNKGLSPTPGPPAQGSSDRKRSPHEFWLQNQQNCGWVRKRLLESQAILLKGPTQGLTWTHLFWGPSWGTSSKVAEVWREALNYLAFRQELEEQLCPRHKCWLRPLLLCILSLHRASRQVSCLQPGSHCSPHPGDSLRPDPT